MSSDMKRYEFEQQHGELGQMRLDSDGEWVRYSDHVEAMKRIAGDGGQQAKPVAWVRLGEDGELRNEFIWGAAIEPVRKQCGQWLPLVIAAPAPGASPVTPAEDNDMGVILYDDLRDAARYRWLRSQHEAGETDLDNYDVSEKFCVFRPGKQFHLVPVGCFPGELDSAIDAAMSTTPPAAEE